MDQIDELPPPELERTLHDRLHRSARAVTPDPDALNTVRARAAGRRRRSRTTVALGSAAAIALVAVGIVTVTGDDATTGVTAGPADGSGAAASADPATLDATLVVTRRPNATPEMIAEVPDLGRDLLVLYVGDTAYESTSAAALHDAAPITVPLDEARRTLDEHVGSEPSTAIAALLETTYFGSFRPDPEPIDSDAQRLTSGLFGLIGTGTLSPGQAAEARRLLEATPEVEVGDVGDDVRVVAFEQAFLYDAATGHPLRYGHIDDPTSDVEYVSVERVASAHLLGTTVDTDPTPPTTTGLPASDPDGDASLVVYRYPNATAEMIAEEPKMRGQWAELNLADRTCHANGPLDQLGGASPCAPSNAGSLLRLIDGGATLEQLELDASIRVPDDLTRLLASGLADAGQVDRVLSVLESVPGVLVSRSDGGATVTISSEDPSIGDTLVTTIDAATGHPLRRSSLSLPTLDIEYLSVTRVRSSDHLIPGRGVPNSVSTTTTSVPPLTTTSAPAHTTTSIVDTGAGR